MAGQVRFTPLRALAVALVLLVVELAGTAFAVWFSMSEGDGVRAAIVEAGFVAPIKGASAGFIAIGHQSYQGMSIYEGAAKWPATFTPAGQCSNLGDPSLPIIDGQVGTMWGAATINADKIDASTNCDGGVCSGWITSTLPFDYHGGQVCVQGGSLCTSNTDGGGLSAVQQSTAISAGPANGFTSQIVFNFAAKTFSLQGCCSSAAGCWLAGRISEQDYPLPVIVAVDAGPPVDSGPVDAGTDAAEAGIDAGAIVAMVPPETSSAGGEPVCIIGSGTNWTTATSTFKFGANSATSITCGANSSVLGCTSTSVCCCMTPPDTGSHNGTGTPSPVTATTSGVSTPAANVATYTPANGLIFAHHMADINVIGSPVTSWNDLFNHNNWGADSGTVSPTTGTLFNGTTHNYIVFNGTANTMTRASPTQTDGGSLWEQNLTECTVYQQAAHASTETAWNATSADLAYQYNTSTQYVAQTNSNVIAGGTVDTAAHLVCAIFGGSGGASSYVCVDGSCTVGTLITNVGITAEWLASIGGSSSWFGGKVVYQEEWQYALNTSTEIPVVHAYSQVNYGTP